MEKFGGRLRLSNKSSSSSAEKSSESADRHKAEGGAVWFDGGLYYYTALRNAVAVSDMGKQVAGEFILTACRCLVASVISSVCFVLGQVGGARPLA